MLTMFDLQAIAKVFPERDKEPKDGQYYFNVCTVDENEEIAFYKFSISGPDNNGPTIVSFLVEMNDPVVQHFGIRPVISFLYKYYVLRWPLVDLVSRVNI